MIAERLLFALDIYRVEGDRLRRDFFEPMRRLGRNRNHIAFAQMVGRAAFRRRSAHLIRRCPSRVHHRSSYYERCLAVDDNEHVTGMLVKFNLAGRPAICQNVQARIVHKGSALSKYLRDLIMLNVMNRRRNTTTE